MPRATNKPCTLVYSCSGCSDVTQLANDVALNLDHSGVAEVSCIAGVPLVKHGNETLVGEALSIGMARHKKYFL